MEKQEEKWYNYDITRFLINQIWASKPIQKDLPIASPPSTSLHEDKP